MQDMASSEAQAALTERNTKTIVMPTNSLDVLPPELRLMIWRFTLPGPRNVGIQMKIKDAGFGGWVVRKNTPPPPVALRVCHESREEARKHYVLSFGTDAFPATVYFNFQTDTLCFSDGINNSSGPCDYVLNLWVGKTFRSRRSQAIQAKAIRFLTMDVDESIYSRPSFCWDEIRRFEGLEKLSLIVWCSEVNAESSMAYFRSAMQAVAEAHPQWVIPACEVVSSAGVSWGTLQSGENETL